MAASARIPAGQKGRYRNRLGGTNDKRPRRLPELTHRPGAIQRIARGCGDPGRLVCGWLLRVWLPCGRGRRGSGGEAVAGRGSPAPSMWTGLVRVRLGDADETDTFRRRPANLEHHSLVMRTDS